jgi:hypothetical protein
MATSLVQLVDLYFPRLPREVFLRWKGFSQMMGGSGASPNMTIPWYHILNYGYPPVLQ